MGRVRRHVFGTFRPEGSSSERVSISSTMFGSHAQTGHSALTGNAPPAPANVVDAFTRLVPFTSQTVDRCYLQWRTPLHVCMLRKTFTTICSTAAPEIAS